MTKQRIDIIGRLGKDPESRQTQGGKTVVNFSLAVSEKYNGKEETTWFNCIAFEKAGENIAKYVKKGDLLNVEGKIKTRQWQDSNGVTKYAWEVIVREFTFLGDKRESSEPKETKTTDGFEDDFSDSAPF